MSYSPKYFDRILEGSINSAKQIVPIIVDLVNPKSVVDVGCGSGAWLKEFQNFGIPDIYGLDQNIKISDLLISAENFLDCDLSKPLPLDRQFDLAICLEVGEHLKPQSAEQLVKSLTKLSDIVLFSAAQPFQGGHKHLNEQWPEYWYEFFKAEGYVIVDAIRKKIWNSPEVEWWYAQNIFLFVKAEQLKQFPKLEQERKHTYESQLSLVHPKSLTLVKISKAFPDLVWRAIKKRIWPKSQS